MSQVSLKSLVYITENFNLDKNDNSFQNVWRSYFFDEDYKEDSLTLKKINVIKDFLERHASLFKFDEFESEGVTYDMFAFLADSLFLKHWPTFEFDFKYYPQHTLSCLKFAANQILLDILNKERNTNFTKHRFPRININVKNYYPITSLINIKENLQGTMISIRGCVVRVHSSQLVSDYKVFLCYKCKLKKVMKQINGLYTEPKICHICGGKKFECEEHSPYTSYIFSQIIKIQEKVNGNPEESTSVEIELTNNLVNSCSLGDIVTITGIIKVQQYKDTLIKDKIREKVFIVKAITIINEIIDIENLHLTKLSKNVEIVNEIKSHTNIFKLLIHSLCPELHGQELVKAALLLSLFGGSRHNDYTEDNINILLVLNPGFKKCQLLKNCGLIAPRGIYVHGSKTCNLTTSHTKEKASSDYFITLAGVLPLINDGYCCIDDLHKLHSQHQALTNAMQNKEMAIIDSRFVIKLSTKLSVLASIQPNSVRYNKSKSLAENINISKTLLSLFELAFVLFDHPDKEHDKMLYDYTMNLHNRKHYPTHSLTSDFTSDRSELSRDVALKQKLEKLTTETIDILPYSAIKIYINHAKQYINPKLSDKAMMILRSYLKAELEQNNNSYLVTSTLKTLIKLTQARAKVDLREKATNFDALDAIEIFEYTKLSLMDHSTPTISNSGKITQNNVEKFIKLLETEAKRLKKTMFSFTDLKYIAEGEHLIISNFRVFIEKLNEAGYLLLSGNDTYKLNLKNVI